MLEAFRCALSVSLKNSFLNRTFVWLDWPVLNKCALFPLNIFDYGILDVDGRWMVVHKTAAGVHCTANPTRLAHPSSLVRFVGILTRTRSRCCSKRQRTQVIWSGFIHVQKLQIVTVYRTTRDTCIFVQASLALVPITCLNSWTLSYHPCRCRIQKHHDYWYTRAT